MANKGKSNRFVRTEESTVDDDAPVSGANPGDEGSDGVGGDEPFEPGKPDTRTKKASESNDMDPESMGTVKTGQKVH